MAELFHSLFGPSGHVSQHPRYKNDTEGYEWNLHVILDESFEFMLQDFAETSLWVQQDEQTLFSYLSGLLDADGAIITTRDQFGKVTIFVDYYNSNKQMLRWVAGRLKQFGYFCSLRINKKRGVRTKKYGIVHRKDYWQLSSYGMRNIKGLVAKLHPRHAEKIRRREIALSVSRGQDYASIEGEIGRLRKWIRQQVRDYVAHAEVQYTKNHLP